MMDLFLHLSTYLALIDDLFHAHVVLTAAVVLGLQKRWIKEAKQDDDIQRLCSGTSCTSTRVSRSPGEWMRSLHAGVFMLLDGILLPRFG